MYETYIDFHFFFLHLFLSGRYDDIICIYRLRFRTMSEKAQWTLDIKPLTIDVCRYVMMWCGICVCMYLYVCVRAPLYWLICVHVYMCWYLYLCVCVYAVHQIYIHSPANCQNFLFETIGNFQFNSIDLCQFAKNWSSSSTKKEISNKRRAADKIELYVCMCVCVWLLSAIVGFE